jgi:tetratricopeptide (TPR) repeat protein
MQRDHLLFLVIGVLAGFLAGYALQEVMAARQPPRLLPGQTQAQAGMTGGPAAGAGAPGGGAIASQQQVQQLAAYVAQNPDDANAVLQLANLNYDIENWSRAAELYSQFLTLRPNSPDVLSDLGICYRGMGRFEDALEIFDRAQQLAPDHWQSLFNEVVVQAFDLKDFAAAEKGLDQLRALQPDNPNVERLVQEVQRQRDAA